jgi:hypothetical protein
VKHHLLRPFSNAVWIFAFATTLLISSSAALAADTQPTSEGVATTPNEETQKRNELVVRLGNESNPPDGVFGPFTYGLRGSHQFENEFAVEAGYIRMHEPHTPALESVLDEAQATVRFPEYHSFTVDATAWKNRTIDMYTNLLGVEITRKGEVSFSLGAYVGTAMREDESGRFRGVQLGASAPLGSVDISAACLLGKIDEGSYRKCGIEGGLELRESSSLPLTVTAAIEKRYFDFGNGRSVSDARDEFIFIAGLEIHLEKILF